MSVRNYPSQLRTEPMTSPRLVFVVLNIVGGLAVLGSYAVGLSTHSEAATELWGGVPGALRPVYTASMLAATAGYFCFTSFILFRVPTVGAIFSGRFDFRLVNRLYAAILFPSALWMPLTFIYLERPSGLLWGLIRVDLALVALGSVALLAALLASNLDRSRLHYRAAIAGLVAFSLQTAVLDAVVWPALFH